MTLGLAILVGDGTDVDDDVDGEMLVLNAAVPKDTATSKNAF